MNNEKGKLGVTYRFYAVVAFVLLLFGQTLLTGLLLGLVLLVERHEWTSRQCMQAFFMSFVNSILGALTSALSSVSLTTMSLTSGVYNGFSAASAILSGAVAIFLLVMSILGLVRVSKGEEANLPLVAGWARKAFGLVQPAVANYPQPGAQPMQQPYGAPVQQAMPQPPAPQPAQPPVAPQAPPMHAQPQAPPAAPGAVPPAPGAPQPPVPPRQG